MEWRCAWCGKPHDEDDPPCDNCGHGTFERAVVRQAPAGDSTTVWVCTECGREHPKHNPPCSRCGNPDLERREQTVGEEELNPPGYLDLVTPRYALGLVAALALAGVLILGVAGVIDVPGLSTGVPSVSDVPGSATELDGVPLADVETAFLERLNALRDERGLTALRRTERLDELAAYFNQRRVKAVVDGAEQPTAGELLEYMDESCGREVVLADYAVPVPDSATTADSLGKRLASRAVENGQGSFEAGKSLTGLDVHAMTDGAVSVTQLAC